MAVEACIVSGVEIKDAISLVALGIAFLALFIAPIVNSRISKRQIIAPMRQAWINALRDKVAEFVSIVSINRWHICPSDSDSSERKNEASHEDIQRYERLRLLAASVQLHINSSEDDHQQLVDLLASIVSDYHDNEDVSEKLDKLIALTQKILSDEWKVTKKT